MPLLQPSFRGRLRLFFAVIVIVPMIAVGVVLFQLLDAGSNFKLDSGLDQAQKTAKAVYQQDRRSAGAMLEPIAGSVDLAMAIEKGDEAGIQEQLGRLADRLGSSWIALERGSKTVQTGSPADAIAAARAPLDDNQGRPLGTITASATTAEQFADDVKRLTEVETRVDRGGRVLTSTQAAAQKAEMPAQPGTEFELAGVDYGQTSFQA